MKIKAVIFDLDGTLLDTLEDLAQAGNRVLRAEGFPVHPVDHYRYFVGDGLQTLIKRILPKNKRNEDHVNRLISSFRADYGQNWKVTTCLYDGVELMLDGLKKRRIKLNVLSNKPQEFTDVCVQSFLGRWTFESVIGQRAGHPRKPDPAGALEIAQLLCLEPSKILYLGDTATDMKTARAAGMLPVGVLWGFRSKDELLKNGAGHLLHHPDELLQLLTSLS